MNTRPPADRGVQKTRYVTKRKGGGVSLKNNNPR